MKDSPLKSSLKELGRLILLVVVSWLITEGVDLLLNQFGAGLSLEFRVTLSGIIVGLLKTVDKFLHEQGKVEGNDSKTLGLTRF